MFNIIITRYNSLITDSSLFHFLRFQVSPWIQPTTKKKAFRDLKTFWQRGEQEKISPSKKNWILLKSSVYLYLHRFLQRLLRTCLLQTSTKNRRTPCGYKIGFRVNYRMGLTYRKKSGQVSKDPESACLLLAILKRQCCGEYVPRPVETFGNMLKGVST